MRRGKGRGKEEKRGGGEIKSTCFESERVTTMGGQRKGRAANPCCPEQVAVSLAQPVTVS